MTREPTAPVPPVSPLLLLGDWIAETTPMLQSAGVIDAARDARLLAAAGCGLTAAQVLADPDRPLTVADISRLAQMRQRRLRREPVSRILGRRGFMNLELEISPATLDPRPDTEILVESTLDILTEESRRSVALSIVDLGTGSGAILIALLQALPLAHGLGVDISTEALDVARRNAARAGVADRVRWHRGDWLDGVGETFDVIVSNPPYIPSADIAGLEPEVADYDPRSALDGGADGLDAYRAIVRQAVERLAPEGWIVLEVGPDQAASVAQLLAQAGLGSQEHARFLQDLDGRLRCVAQKTHIKPALPK